MIHSGQKNKKSMYIFLGISGFVLFLLQSSVLPFLADAKGIPCPDLLLCFACIIPCFADIKTSAVFALCAGFVADLFINYPSSLSPVVYLSGVCLVYLIYRFFSGINTVTAAVCAIPAFFVEAAVGFFGTLFAFGESAQPLKIVAEFFVYSPLVNFATILVISFITKPVLKKMKIYYA